MTIEQAIIECQTSAHKALADMAGLWSRLSKDRRSRSDSVKELLRTLNRASPQDGLDPNYLMSVQADGIFGLPLVNAENFPESVAALLRLYDDPAGQFNPPLWLRLIPGWLAIIDALGVKEHLIAVSVAVNNGDGGPASSSVVLNSNKNLSDLSTLSGANKIRTFVVTLQRPDADGSPDVPALPYINHGIRLVRATDPVYASFAPYLQIGVKPDPNGEFDKLILPETAIAPGELQNAWVAAFVRWLIDGSSVASLVSQIVGELVDGQLTSLPIGADKNQIKDYLEFISKFCPNGELPEVLDTIFCPAVLWSVDPAQQGSAANCYFIFKNRLTDEQARILLHTSQTLLVGVGQFSTGHFLESARVEELMRAEQMLLKLQRPLDELTDAFNRVQAEAQEMQAILNSPEESLFRAQKLVADIFIDQKSIKVSDTLTAKPAHVPNELEDPDLQMLYVLVLCSIFGRRADLRTATSSAAVLGYGRDILRDAERSPVFGDLCMLVRLVTEAANNRASIGETIDVLPGESNDDRVKRQRRVLTRLKMLLFEPFKDFSSTYWAKGPFIVAVEDNQAKLDRLQPPPDSTDLNTRLAVKHDFSPFPQHGILGFILAAKGEFENRAEKNLFASVDFPVNSVGRSTIRIAYKGDAFFSSRKALNHFSFLCHAADHGVSGSNFGNFLGSYARLLRHAHSLNAGLTASVNADWRLCDPNSSRISLAIERSDKQRFFWIEHSDNAAGGTLSLVWSDCGWENGETESCSVGTSATGKSVEVDEALVASHPKVEESSKATHLSSCEVKCFVCDHRNDGPWASALMEVGEIEGKRGTLKFVGERRGNDRPEDSTIPQDAQVLILHTQTIDAWLETCGGKYAIVRVSTHPASLKLPNGVPQSVKLLKYVVPSDFQEEQTSPQRLSAESGLLKAVFDALDAKVNSTVG